MLSKSNLLNDISVIHLPTYQENNGELVVMEGLKVIPFSIARVFFVRAASGSVRGQHAHKECSQVLICVEGSIRVYCEDGEDSKEYLLDSPYTALLIPPTIWSEQTYFGDRSAMMVICDMHYEEKEYIRNYSDFLNFRKNIINLEMDK